MIFTDEKLKEKYITCIEKYKAEGYNIKDLTYAITLGDYFDRGVEGVNRLNTEKIVILTKTEPEIASALGIIATATDYTEIEDTNARRLLYSLLATLQTGSLKNLEGSEEDIALLLKKEESDETTNFKVVEELLSITDNNKFLVKKHKGLKKYCYDNLTDGASEAEQALAVFDVLLLTLFTKNNAVDDAMLRVNLYNAREQMGITKFDYTWHISENVYNKLQTKEYIKKLLYTNFNVKKQSKKIYEADKADIMKMKASFNDIITLLFK